MTSKETREVVIERETHDHSREYIPLPGGAVKALGPIPQFDSFAINPVGEGDICVEGSSRFAHERDVAKLFKWARAAQALIASLVKPEPEPTGGVDASDGRPAGWTEAIALRFIAMQGHNPEIGMFAKSFNEGAWSEITEEWPEFADFVKRSASLTPAPTPVRSTRTGATSVRSFIAP